MSTIVYKSNFNSQDSRHYPSLNTLEELQALPKFNETYDALVSAKSELNKAKAQASKHDTLIRKRIFAVLSCIANITLALVIIVALAGALSAMPVGGAFLTIILGFIGLPFASAVGEWFLISRTMNLFNNAGCVYRRSISNKLEPRKTAELKYATMMYKIHESEMHSLLRKHCGRINFAQMKEFVTLKLDMEANKLAVSK